ncbi:MAG: type II secretion system GspH family protein [Candidatus Omnitrophica bacterium]|nr:type II secretion system GspH family protein [Candidatus Omnitrophota bacterium]
MKTKTGWLLRAGAGFTLIELLIVIVLIGVLSFLAMPLFRDFINFSSLKKDAWSLQAAMRACRQQAIAEHLNYRFIFDTAADSYTIEKRDPATGALLATVRTENFENDLISAAAVTFRPRGETDVASTISIRGEKSADTVTLSVQAATGLVSMTGL